MNDAQSNATAQAEHLTTANFDEKLTAAGDQPVMVDFFAQWCGPCKIAAPVVDELAGEYAGKAHIYKVDVDEEPQLAQRYGVMSIPTVIILKNSKPVGQPQIGFPGKAGYVQLLEKALA